MAKIFITIPWFLPAFRAGGPVQSVANLIKEYSKEAEYFIFCGDTDLNGLALENVEVDKWVTFNEQTKVWYCSPEKISDKLINQIELQKPDILFIVGMYSWHFNIVPLIFSRETKKILSTRGMLHPGALSQKKWKKKMYLLLFKLLGYHYKVTFHATDEEEAKYIINYFGKPAKVCIAGNFANKIGKLTFPEKKPGHLKLITIALISPMKNILKVLEALEQSSFQIEYHIYGPLKDEGYWDLCKQQIKRLPEKISVIFHKEIEPSKIKDVLSNAHVFILPSKSENFGHAIYEALSAGRPVITSHFTPWNSLKEQSAGINVSIDKGTEINEAINFFASMDHYEMESWSVGAYDYSERMVDFEKMREGYRRMLLSSMSA